MTFIEPREPGGEINLKAKRRWESLRRTNSYRQDWDKAFAQMVKMLKKFPIIESNDLGCKPDREQMKESIDELMKDPKTWKDFLKRKFQRDWPQGKLMEEFLYSRYVTQGKKLAEKYGLSIPYKYDDPVWDPYKKRMKPVFKDMMPVRVISHNPSSYEIGKNHEVIADHTPNLRGNRWLTIEIDIHEKMNTLRKIINSQLDFFQNSLNLPKAKKRGQSLDFYIDTDKGKVSIYELWEMHTKDGKSPWDITQELCPSETNGKHYQPNNNKYDRKVRRIWKQIDEGIKTADSDINNIISSLKS